MQGPDLVSSLIGVLICFWKEQVAITADIESMFHQVQCRSFALPRSAMLVVASKRPFSTTLGLPHDGTLVWCHIFTKLCCL